MKKFFFSVAALAAALTFTACSSEDVISSNENAVPQWNENGVGYMAISVTMPKDVATRAAQENDQFDKGEIAEYEVKNGLCLIFNGSTKHFSQAFEIDKNFGNGKDGNITTDNLIVKQVKAVDDPKVLVVLNSNGLVTYNETTNELTVNGSKCESMTQFQNMITSVDKYKEDGFLMLNAPLWSKQGTTANPKDGVMTIFADANSAIYKTETEARHHESGVTEVYVERALAKVTLNAPTTKKEVADAFDWEVNSWVLDNTNTTSYLLREVTNLTDTRIVYNAENKGYRMVGGVSVKHENAITNGSETEADNYRTYFGRSTNYAGAGTLSTNVYDWTNANAVNTNDYCAENVFEVAHMNYKNTTRVVLKTTLTPATGESLYAKAGDPAFYKQEDVKKLAYNAVITNVTEAEKTEINTALSASSKDITTVQYEDAEITIAASEDKITVKLGTWTKDVTASTLGLSYYAGGVAYYDVRIKHFGDTYTPWDADAHTEANNINQSYGSDGVARENAYLGRWGVLRNNWYLLDVKNITKVGYATTESLRLDDENPDDPTYGDTPDDNKKTEQWIAVDVNILSWAKRFQDVEL